MLIRLGGIHKYAKNHPYLLCLFTKYIQKLSPESKIAKPIQIQFPNFLFFYNVIRFSQSFNSTRLLKWLPR